MLTVTADKVLPCTITGSWPRPRWFDQSMWGRPLDTCLMDVRFREAFQDALATVLCDNDSYRASFELYLNECRGDFWTIETKDRNMREIELFAPLKGKLKKKICIGAVSHRTLQVERAEDVVNTIRQALKHIAPEQLIVSSDCGFGRQGCNRDIAFFKSTAIAQGTNIVRRELGLPETRVRAADPALQSDIVPKTPDR
jgi:5-methyltetrahydropteroyltriglutamate--homocysteine methyltransferase